MEFIRFCQIDKFHALSVAARLADVFHERAHHLPADGYHHDLVRISDRQRANHASGLFIGFHGDDPLAAAGLDPILIKGRPFADAIFAGHEQRGVGHHRGESDNSIATL